MIKLINVTKKYKDKVALDNVCLELPDTGLIAISGENGSGKSTLMNLIGALDNPTKGSIIVDDLVLTHKSEGELSEYREKYVGFMFQDNNLFENMTVEENLKIVNTNQNFDKLMEALKIKHLLDKKARELSGGEQQRVVIARAILKDPKILLADEPTASLDREAKTAILKLLKSLSRKRLVILISHDDYEVEEYADVYIELENGKVSNVNFFKNEFDKNEMKPCQNKFNTRKFAHDNLLTNKKRIVRTGVLFIISFLFILLATAISTLDLVDMQAETMILEGDDYFTFEVPSDKEIDEKILSELEKVKISSNPLLIGKSIGGVEYYNKAFEFDPTERKDLGAYYRNPIKTYSYFDVEALKDIDVGVRPSNAYEVVITSYLADLMLTLGVKDESGEYYKPESYESLVTDKRKLLLGNNYVTISGITKLKLENFEKLKKPHSNTYDFDMFQDKIRNTGGDIFVTDDFFEAFKSEEELNPIYNFSYDEVVINGYSSMVGLKPFKEPVLLSDGSNADELHEGEIIIRESDVKSFGIYTDTAVGSKINLYVRTSSYSDTEAMTLTVKGISKDGSAYYNTSDFKKYFWDGIAINKIVMHESDKDTIKKLIENYDYRNNTTEFSLSTNYSNKYSRLEEKILLLIVAFGIASAIFILLAVINLVNLILNSIDEYKKDIALLKSLGVRDDRISLSFIIETGIILVMSYVYALVGFFIVRLLINWVATKMLSFKVDIVPIKFLLILLIIGIMVFLSGVISLIVFRKIKKTSPQLLFKKTDI